MKTEGSDNGLPSSSKGPWEMGKNDVLFAKIL